MNNITYKGFVIRKKPWFIRLFARRAMGAEFFGHIYIRDDYYNKLAEDQVNIDPETRSYLEHEIRHVERLKEVGLIKLGILYYFFRSVRLREEMEAIKKEMQMRKAHDLGFEFEKRARSLSGYPYLWTSSYEDALRKLKDLWEKT